MLLRLWYSQYYSISTKKITLHLASAEVESHWLIGYILFGIRGLCNFGLRSGSLHSDVDRNVNIVHLETSAMSKVDCLIVFGFFFFFFEMESWELDWPQTMLLLISASQIAKITGVSPQCLAWSVSFIYLFIFLPHHLRVPEYSSLALINKRRGCGSGQRPELATGWLQGPGIVCPERPVIQISDFAGVSFSPHKMGCTFNFVLLF
jgi:hypothetical protein